VTLARATFDLPAGTFHALVGGDPTAPPLVYLHGFPDHPPTAAAFLEQLARTRRVIAPWLRGYAPSPRVGPYDLATVAGDVVALLEQLDGKVDLVGHDWGAITTYSVCVLAPERVRRAATLAIPHPITFLRSLGSLAQLRKSWYVALFQLPGAPQISAASDFALIDRLWRAWSPGFTLGDDRRRELHACLAASMPAPINYYRALRQQLLKTPLRRQLETQPITTPVLQLHGADDGCILPPSGDDGDRFVDRELEVIPSRGHFLQLEDPVGIGERITAWLTKAGQQRT
jgi:pimeloyl-ACP methyl ester carboxylesterase